MNQLKNHSLEKHDLHGKLQDNLQPIRKRTPNSAFISAHSNLIKLECLPNNSTDDTISLKQTIIETKKELNRNQEENKHLKTKVKQLEKMLIDYEKQIINKQPVDSESFQSIPYRQHIQQLQLEIKELQSQYQQLQKSTKATQLAELQQSLQLYESECQNLKSLLVENQKFMSQCLNKDENSQQQMLLAQQKQIRSLEEEIENLHQQLQQKHKINCQMKNLSNEQENKLQNKIIEKDKMIKELQEQLSKQDRIVATFKSKMFTNPKPKKHYVSSIENPKKYQIASPVSPTNKNRDDEDDKGDQPSVKNVCQTQPSEQNYSSNKSQVQRKFARVLPSMEDRSQKHLVQSSQEKSDELIIPDQVNQEQISDACEYIKLKFKLLQVKQTDVEQLLFGDKEMITTQNLMEQFQKSPFDMTDQIMIKKISRYIVEEYDMNNHKRYDVNQSQSCVIAKSIVKKLFNLTNDPQNIMKSENYQNLIMNLKKFQGAIKQYLCQVTKNNAYATKQQFIDAFNHCGVELNQQSVEILVTLVILNSKSVREISIEHVLALEQQQ